MSEPERLELQNPFGLIRFAVRHTKYTSGVETTVDVEVENESAQFSDARLSLDQVAELRAFCEAVLAMRGREPVMSEFSRSMVNWLTTDYGETATSIPCSACGGIILQFLEGQGVFCKGCGRKIGRLVEGETFDKTRRGEWPGILRGESR